MNYEVVIGLEVHVQLNTNTKIFCGCSTSFGAPANSHVCPVCMGQPGVLPVMNAAVLEKSITAGLALNCEIASYSKFDRKNYFYPDLPKGYQISQFEFPICLKGYIDIDKDDGSVKRIGITRAHMEEDAGKLIHAEGTNYSLVDLNRAGVPLLEVVSEPDMRSSEEAYLYLKSLKAIMKTVGVSDVNMEEGSLRCDANVSVRPFGQKEFGTKVEVKNMNSFSGVRKAIDYEVGRQIDLIESGGKIVQETRLFDVKQNKTFSMRSKEEANDYRYFPEPDLPPLRVESARIDSIKNALPELPRPRRQRFASDYKIAPMDAETLAEDRELADYFEAVVKCGGFEPKKASNWIMAEVLGILNEKGQLISDFAKTVPAANLAELLQMVEKGLISGKIAKDIFPDMLTGKKASAIVEAKGLKQESDSGALEAVIDKILAANPGEVEKFKAGNTKLMGFFVGEAMKATRGQANPKLLNEILKNRLG